MYSNKIALILGVFISIIPIFMFLPEFNAVLISKAHNIRIVLAVFIIGFNVVMDPAKIGIKTNYLYLLFYALKVLSLSKIRIISFLD